MIISIFYLYFLEQLAYSFRPQDYVKSWKFLTFSFFRFKKIRKNIYRATTVFINSTKKEKNRNSKTVCPTPLNKIQTSIDFSKLKLVTYH